MRKIYLFAAVLFGLGSAMPIMTGCQRDYEGQIEIIRNQIKNGNINIESLKDKVKLIEEQIKELEDALVSEDEAIKEEINRVISELQTTKSELNDEISRLEGLIKNNGDDIIRLENAINEASEKFNTKLLEISADIDKINSSINILDGRVGKLEDQVSSLVEKQAAVEETINKLKEEIANLQDTTRLEQLEEALKKLEELNGKLTQDIESARQLVEAVKTATEENATNLDILRSKTAQDIAQIKSDIDSEIFYLSNQMAGLSTSVTALSNSVEMLNRKYDNLGLQLNEMQSAYNLQIQKIWEKINNLGAGEDVEELQQAMAEMQVNFRKLMSDVELELGKMLDTQNLFGEDLQDIEDTLNYHNNRLNSLEEKFNNLDLRVSQLEMEIKNIQDAYSKTIEEINKRIEALENSSGGGNDYSETIELMKNDLETLKNQLKEQINEINSLKGEQDSQAKKLAELDSFARTTIATLEANYKTISGNVDELYNFIAILDTELKESQTLIADLTSEVNTNTGKIAELEGKINEIINGSSNYITREEMEQKLKEVNTTLESKITEVLTKLDQYTTKDEVEALIDQKHEEMQNAINSLTDRISTLEKNLDDLTTQVEQLMSRIQSFELIPDYNDGTIMVERTGNESFKMSVEIEVTPNDLVESLASMQGIFSLRFRDVATVRGVIMNVMNDNVTITGFDKTKGILNLEAETTIKGINYHDQPLKYQVAVELNDGNNHRISEYRGLRQHIDVIDQNVNYIFKDGENTIETNETSDFGSFKEENINLLKILTDQGNVCQIDGENKLFQNVTASSGNGNGIVADKIAYELISIHNKDKSDVTVTLSEYIEVTYEGIIRMAYGLGPNTPTIENYYVTVGMQGIKDEKYCGKKAYVCFKLQKK